MFSQIDKFLLLKKEVFMIGKERNLVGTKWDQEKNILDKSGFIDGCLEEIKRKYNLLSAFLLYQQ